MQRFIRLSAIAAGAALVSGAAVAGPAPFKGEARLVNVSSAPREETIAGVAWRCDGDACVGEARVRPNLDGVVRECRKVVAVVGPVASYRTSGRQLTDGELKACNRAAPDLQTAAK
jgi:hypothetical protein